MNSHAYIKTGPNSYESRRKYCTSNHDKFYAALSEDRPSYDNDFRMDEGLGGTSGIEEGKSDFEGFVAHRYRSMCHNGRIPFPSSGLHCVAR